VPGNPVRTLPLFLFSSLAIGEVEGKNLISILFRKVSESG